MLKTFVTPNGKEIEFEVNDMDELLQKSIEYMKKHHPTTKEKLMLNQAVDFHRVANSLFPKSIDKEGLKGKPTVFMVNASFSLEIYLKLAVKISTDSEKTGHKLQNIYKSLSDDAKKEIEKIFQKKVKNTLLNLKEPITVESFIIKLNETFETWRYKYESNDTFHFHMNEAAILLDVLNNYCTKYMKEITNQSSQ